MTGIRPSELPPLDLNPLLEDMGAVKIGEREFRVRQINYGDWRALKVMQPADPTPLFEVAARVLVDAPADVIESLNVKQAWAIINRASGAAATVETHIPNTSTPAGAGTPPGGETGNSLS